MKLLQDNVNFHQIKPTILQSYLVIVNFLVSWKIVHYYQVVLYLIVYLHMKQIGKSNIGKCFTIARLFTIQSFTITRFDCKYFYCAQPSFDRIFHSIALRKMIDLYLLVFFNCDAFLFPAIIILIYDVIWSFNFSISCTYLKTTFTVWPSNNVPTVINRIFLIIF